MKATPEVISFIRKVFGTQDRIPLHEPRFMGNEKKYLIDTIDSTYVSSVGPYVQQFEEMMQVITGTYKALAMVNGTAALQLALQLVGVKPGDEVLTQALSFVATSNAIRYNGATPVYIDVDLDTMGLSPTAVETFLETFGELREDGCYHKHTGRKISACVPMHTFGFPVHLDALQAICAEWRIPLVEDAAEAIGSSYHGRPAGSFGRLGIFSFNGNKTVTSGGGGAIVTNDLALAELGKHLSTTAKQSHPYEFYHDMLGYNFRMPNLNAALACAQLEQLPAILTSKRELASLYERFFSEKGIKFRTESPDTQANYWLMCIELENKAERESFLKESQTQQVMCRPIWQLMYQLPMYAHCQRDLQRNAEFLADRIVNIPSSVRI